MSLDLDSILDSSIDDLVDLPEFGIYPSGVHRVIINWESKEVNKHPSMEMKMKLVETVELANPAEDQPVTAGQESSSLFMLDNEFGQGAFKQIMKTLAAACGTNKISETVEIVGLAEATRSVVVTGIEMFRKQLDQAMAGDNVGLLLRGVQRTDIERGQVLAKPNSIHPHTHFMGRVYVLTKEEGGRHTPFFSGYRPQFYFRTTDVTGSIELPAGVEMVMPGDHIDMNIQLITTIAIEPGLRFAIREGGRTVASGVVTEILDK